MPSSNDIRPESAASIPIAIVGMSGLFPQADNLRTLWQNILNRVDAIREVPEERWRQEDYFDADRLAADKVYSKWGGFLDPVRFDPMKWKIPPASLASIDPIQLLSLEVADRAFADAGYDHRPFPKERTGVIFACAGTNDVGSDYAFRTMISHHLPRMNGIPQETQDKIVSETHDLMPEWTEDSFPGILTNVIAGRIANRFDLGGPNFTVDAACAASLAALYSAIAQLRIGAVDMMLVGAADGSNNAFTYMCFAKTHALSPRGRSRPFDDSADGIALGEGIAAILIKRLDDAIRDGDKVYAVIRGIGSSSDGRNRSMTAPHPGGQILALKRAYADADLSCTTISLIEAHGTGTAVGDGTEITSLNTLYSQECTDKQFVAVGSVKSMIGHTKTCAGLASLVKTALALHHKVLPPTLHVEFPNRKVDFQNSAFFVNSESRPWFEELGDHPRRAGISAFGFGGTNFHVVLEETPAAAISPTETENYSPRPSEILTWFRPTRLEIAEALRQFRDQVEKTPVGDFAQLAFSCRHDEITGSGQCRLVIVASDLADLLVKIDKTERLLGERDAIQDPTGVFYSEKSPVSADSVAFLYPGQGSQSLNMLRDLAIVSRWCHQLFAEANHSLNDFFPKALTRYIFPPPAFTPEELEHERAALNQTQVAQPALGLVEVFATELLKRFGIEPAVTAGHSYGEYVALYAAGCLSQEDLLTLSAHRGRISFEAGQSTSPGAMAAVNAGAIQLEELIRELGLEIQLANLNAPDQSIIAGTEPAIAEAMEALSGRNIRCKRLAVSGAFHTPLMAAAAEQLSEILDGVKFHKPQKTVYSNTLANRYPEKPAEIRKLLERHIAEPVLFEQQIRQMRADGVEVFFEVGPNRVLTGLVQRIFPQDGPTCIALDANGRDGMTQLAHVLGQLVALGLPVNLDEWYAGRGLKECPVAEYLQQEQGHREPKRTEWILTTYNAKPVTPLPPRSENKDGLQAKFGKKATAESPAPETPKAKPAPAASNSNHNRNGNTAKTETRPAPVVVASTASKKPSSTTRSASGGLPTAPSCPSFSPLSAGVSGVPTSSQLRSIATMNSTTLSDDSAALNGSSGQLLLQSQTLMMQMLDLQKWQQQVALKFVETHQQLIHACTTGGPLPASLMESMIVPATEPQPVAAPAPTPAPAPVQATPAVMHAPAPVVRPAAAPVAVRAAAPVISTPRVTVPVEKKTVAAPSRNGNGTAHAAPTSNGASENGNGHHAHNGNGSHAAATAKSASATESNGAGLPSVDQFRAALLKAVSERTGYPEDMLDETLPLESGLGIDSIKTVEIFSNLKDYHKFFLRDGQDEEEALKEFTQLKTLADIIRNYETQHAIMSAAAGNNGSESESTNRVERYAVEAVEAPALAGKKKSSRLVT